MARKYDYYVNVLPKKEKETKVKSFFRIGKSKKTTSFSKEPEVRFQAIDQAEASKIKKDLEKGGNVKAEVQKVLGPERTVTVTQRVTGSLRAEPDVNHDELRKNVNNALPTSSALLPKVPTEEIYKESAPAVEVREEDKE